MKKHSYKKFKKKQLLFYISVIALPLLQVAIFYFYVNFKSFLFAFQTYDYSSGKYIFAGLTSIKKVFYDMLTQRYLLSAMINSLILLGVSLFVGCLFSVIFSYYISKKRRLGELFKVILFLPAIISSITLVIMYRYFVVNALPELISSVTGFWIGDLIDNYNTVFYTVLFYCVFAGFSTQVLLYIGAMKAVSLSIVEAAELDGATYAQQFFYIFFPLIWPTYTTFIVLSFAGVFNNQMGLYQFFDVIAPPQLWTYGYYLYRSMVFKVSYADYPYLSGMAILLTAVSVPVALLIRRLMFKYGPSTD